MRHSFAALVLALGATCVSGSPSSAQDAPPPSPRAGLDYRVVYKHGPEGRLLEVRRSGEIFRQEMVNVSRQAAILYDTAAGTATVIDGASVLRMPITPGSIGGLDAAATMAAMSEVSVRWRTGEARTVAGTECRDHHAEGVRDDRPLVGVFCVTADGVPLAYTLGGPGQIGRAFTAATFEIGPQPPEFFEWARKMPDEAKTSD